MAAEIRYELTEAGTNAMDYAEHERTYARFLQMAKWVVILVAAVLILMAVFLTGGENPTRVPAAPTGAPGAATQAPTQPPAAAAAH